MNFNQIDFDRFSAEELTELSVRMMNMDWENGRACGPDTLDYVRAVDQVLAEKDVMYGEFASAIMMRAAEKPESELLERIYDFDCEGHDASAFAAFLVEECRRAAYGHPADDVQREDGAEVWS